MDQAGSNDETGGRKSRWTVPLRRRLSLSKNKAFYKLLYRKYSNPMLPVCAERN